MKVSVVVPVYNAEKYLEKCLCSVISQTYEDWELIAIDDGSSDNSYKILEAFAKRDFRIKIGKKEREGPGLTRNAALERATGDFVVFLDADDYIEPDYFELLKREADIKHADVVFTDVILEDPAGRIIRYEQMSRFRHCSRKELLGCQMTGYMPWGGCRKAASRTLIEREQLRYTDDVVGEEAVFSFELLRHAGKIAFIQKSLYHYVNHPGSQSKNPLGNWEITLDKMRRHLLEKGILCEYEDCLNAFAFTVMILWLLRKGSTGGFWECRKKMKEQLVRFEGDYGWKINRGYLRKEISPLVPLFQKKIVLPAVIAAKVISGRRLCRRR